MPDREDWVMEQHAWSSVTHDTAHPPPHGWLVAMHGALGTGRFPAAKGAFVDTFYCIRK
jgi:hypothetical protein